MVAVLERTAEIGLRRALGDLGHPSPSATGDGRDGQGGHGYGDGESTAERVDAARGHGCLSWNA